MGIVFTKFEKNDGDIADIELIYIYFYEEDNQLCCCLTYDVTYRSGKVNRVRIKNINTGIRIDQFVLSSDGTKNAVHWPFRQMWFDSYAIDTISEPEPLEVTIEEIEKKFGRKVKIVDKKEDEKDD